jgi:energy-coupling factor transporter transmembrane protein EcfT
MPDLLLPFAALLPHSPTPYIVLMLAGFAIGILGHLAGARWLVAAGVILIFLGALLFPFLANVTTENRPPPIEESRGDAGTE